MKTTKFLGYSGEMSRVRFWQEAALAAVPAILAQLQRDAVIAAVRDETGAAAEAVARDVSRLAFEIAERMYVSHGEPVTRDLDDKAVA